MEQLLHRRSLLAVVVVILVVVGVLGIYSYEGTSESTTPDVSQTHPVLWVYDGDTIQVSIDGRGEVVRLLGIDTPEVAGPHEAEECFGKEASAYVKELLSGKRVALAGDEQSDDRDKFNRLLRYIYLEDGTFVNQKLVEEGYAEVFRAFSFEHKEEFLKLEASAQASELGLWGACDE